MPLPKDCSEAEDNRQIKAATDAGHENTSQVWERVRQLPGQIDRFIEEQVENGRLSPESPIWWTTVRSETIKEHEAQLDEGGMEKLNDVRLYHTNALFWLLAFLGWVWVFLHKSHMLTFIQEAAPIFPGASLYQNILQYWGLVALVMAVYCFGTRRISQSIPEQMARFPGIIAVTIVFAMLSNGIAGVISGMIHGSLILASAVIVAFIGLYSASCIISKGKLDTIISEGTGVIVGLLLGVCLNAIIYGYAVGFAGGAVSFAALGMSQRMADADSVGSVWVRRTAYMALLISWIIISGFVLQDSMPGFLHASDPEATPSACARQPHKYASHYTKWNTN